MQEVLIEAGGVSKKFCKNLKRSLWYGTKDLAATFLGLSENRTTLRQDEFWAVKDVSFQLRRGECLGLLGYNGAGKSTLLKMLNGLIRPDEGEIRIRGRVGALIELGAGFNPILSGRENVYINGQILGLSKKDIDNRFDSIVDFAAIADFIDAPVQTYSSGMKARLGFAVAAQMNPDVLLIDEVLAVGDIKFRGKCYRRIAELRQAGTCIIFVSHSILSILATCNTGLFLHRGQMLASGNIGDVVAAYEVHSLLEQTTTENAAQNGHFTKNTSLRIETVALQDGTGAACDYLTVGQYATLCISGSATEPLQNVIFSFLIRDCAREDTTSLYFDSETEGIAFDVPTGRFETRLEIPFFGLGPGVYLLKVNARLKNFYVLDADESVRFKVVRSPAFAQGAMFQLPHQWHFETVPSLSAQPTDNV